MTIYNAEGRAVYTRSLLPTIGDNEETYLPEGDHEFRFNPADANLAPGVYAIEFDAVGSAGDPAALLPTIEGLVTGAILAGDPSIRMGNRIFSVADVLEVKLPRQASPAPSSTAPSQSQTGGGQTVLGAPTWNAPQRGAS